MTFEELLDQAIDMLRRRGRVTYRALKLQFQLDDNTLDVLKDELIYGQQLAVDEEGRVLVWGGPPATPPAADAPSFATQAVPADQARPVDNVPTPAAIHAPRVPDAERRPLTVLFCDLVDSTTFARQLDPEEWREVVRAYHATCAEVIARFEGYIAQYLGDGLLVYFGYPGAHEDDAVRAVRTGLGILDAIGALHVRLAQDKGIDLAVRIGIHTGLVVVGEIGGGTRREHLALGETPNIAARLQSLATPGRMVLSEQTQRLVGRMFDYDTVTTQMLKGLTDPVRVYWVHGASAVESRFEAATIIGLTPLVGRDGEIDLLLRRWEQAREGEGQVVLLAGEAGIGKSRITQALRERLSDEPHLRLRAQCLPYYSNSAFYPFIAHLERAMACERDAPPAVQLDALEALLAQAGVPLEEVVPLLAALLSIPSDDRYAPLTLSPQQRKDKTIDALIDQVRGLAQQQPVLYIFEDVHWIDPTSLEALARQIDRLQDARVLLVITYRPEFTPPWGGFTHVTTHTLNRLSRRQVATMVPQITGGRALPQEVLDQIVARTDGVPLFVEELTKTILESGLLRDDGERYTLAGPLPALAIPDTLQSSLLARLDRLGAVKDVAQLGAAIGREFSYALLAAVSPLPDTALQAALHQLVQAELVFRRGELPEATYLFKHALIQDAAYGSLLRSTRQELHAKIAQVLEARFPTLVAAEPEVVAHHYTEAGRNVQAIPYWQQAGQRALERSATREAVAHLTKGLEGLATLPDTPERAQQELALHITLGPALMNTKGFEAPEVLHAYTQAHALCQQVGDARQLFAALWGLFYVHTVRGEMQRGREMGEELLGVAQRLQDPGLLVVAHRALVQTLFWRGELGLAHTHAQHALARYDPQQMRDHAVRYGQDPVVYCRLVGAVTLWLLGYPDQARQWSEAALTQAQGLRHAYTLQQALCFSALLHLLRREAAVAQERAEAQRALCTEQGFASYLAWGTIFRGAAVAAQGAWAEGLAQMREALAAYRATARRPWLLFLGLLAEACGRAGQVEEGLRALREALEAIQTTEERICEVEVYRLKGELLLQQSAAQQGEAEASLHQALTVARRQQAKSLELRAAMSLSRLWQQQGKRAAAYELLAPIYGWFTEGFDTADLQEAKALLEALA